PAAGGGGGAGGGGRRGGGGGLGVRPPRPGRADEVRPPQGDRRPPHPRGHFRRRRARRPEARRPGGHGRIAVTQRRDRRPPPPQTLRTHWRGAAGSPAPLRTTRGVTGTPPTPRDH